MVLVKNLSCDPAGGRDPLGEPMMDVSMVCHWKDPFSECCSKAPEQE